jgi:homoserine dehydrogenase
MAQTASADLLLEASPANMQNGQPGLGCIEAALTRGMHAVTANKAPLVLAFPRLLALARTHGVKLRFDATVAGGLPAVNLGQRDLAAADIHRLEGVLNLTTNYILTRMAQDGLSYDQALADAQAAGHAETDPSLDVEGWDAANKLVILAHSVLGQAATLDDVAVEGILGVTAERLARSAAGGKRVKLVATAEKQGEGYRLSVRPTSLDAHHPLAQLGPKQMGIVYHTDISGIISAAIVEETPVPTASAMLRDVVDIYSA